MLERRRITTVSWVVRMHNADYISTYSTSALTSLCKLLMLSTIQSNTCYGRYSVSNQALEELDNDAEYTRHLIWAIVPEGIS